MNLKDISAHWVALHEALGVGAPIATEEQYESLLELVGQIMDDTATAEGPMSGLAALLADRIREYEHRVHPWSGTSTPATVLASLIQAHGLRQSDLPEVDSQGVVSEVLAGRRALNARQIKALSRRFSVPAEVLLR